MERKILFKAKRTDNGEWVEGNLFIDDKGNEAQILIGYTNYRVGWKVDKATICQYTGLTDDSGARIWENDVVFIPYEDENFKVSWESDSARFALDGDGLTIDFDNMYGYECEVIGNIFDNPELIEAGGVNE